MIIRKFQKDDIDQVMTIWLNSNIDVHPFVDKQYWKDNFDEVRKALLQAEALIAEKDGKIFGFAGLQADYLAGIFVSKEYRGHGIGGRLLKTIKQTHSSFTLHVYAENTSAYEFYLHQGMKVVKKQVDDTGNKEYEMKWTKEGDKPAGTIEGKDVDVTYVYRLKKIPKVPVSPEVPVNPPVENTYKITVNFVDENGNPLQDPRTSSDNKNGTDYNETDHPTTITKDGKTYVYTRVEDDPVEGTINGRDVVVTYIYKEVVQPSTSTSETTSTPDKQVSVPAHVEKVKNESKNVVSQHEDYTEKVKSEPSND